MLKTPLVKLSDIDILSVSLETEPIKKEDYLCPQQYFLNNSRASRQGSLLIKKKKKNLVNINVIIFRMILRF